MANFINSLHRLLPKQKSCRSFSSVPSLGSKKPSSYNYNPDPFAAEPLPAGLLNFPRKTAESLANSTSRRPPRRVRLLSREFIEDSLCNPHYGYFATQVEILDSPEVGIPFEKISNLRSLEAEIANRYGPRQSWHTPTELFKPWYANAVARCLLSRHQPNEPLRIYEIGAGNGTLCEGVLNYIRDHAPTLYSQTTYTIIEVSARLAGIQAARASRAGHKLQIIPHNVFSLPQEQGDSRSPIESEPCWVIAMELVDNLARDVVRYDRTTGEVLMASVGIDENGEFHEYFEPICDQINPSLSRYLQHHQLRSKLTLYDRMMTQLPFGANLSRAEFVPTRTFELLEIIRDRFPNHKLLLSDFDHLPQSIKGIGAPVVQTRYEGMTVPCTTYLVQPGRFDIFFPTDFDDFIKLYQRINPSRPNLQDFTHAEFVSKYHGGDFEKTCLLDGSNPMVEYYENVKVVVSE
ncbi:S-adenosyl-L-methionine-dependent methyltransferase [Melampsora americana]|nr:S-adenosyl-L-methionine-dependent methyltransferase [Melampsora americana]